jgi:hypothetical protein
MSRRGKELTGWGVEVRLPGHSSWHILTKPGREEPLSTHLEGARAWMDDYSRRGCAVRIVELPNPRGRAFRAKPHTAASPATLSLFA